MLREEEMAKSSYELGTYFEQELAIQTFYS
jgi:hypothetical protein